MIITFKRPMFTTDKYLDIYQDKEQIGKMRNWSQDKANKPENDVNIEITNNKRQYKIIQENTSMLASNEWQLFDKKESIANMHGGQLNELDKIKAQFHDGTTLLVKAEGLFKSGIQIFVNDIFKGEVFSKGILFNGFYEINLNDSEMTIDPILLAGIIYVFFLISNLG